MMSSSHLVSLASAAALALALVRRARAARAAPARDRSGRWNDIYSRKGRAGLADASTPLHVLGGYDMYTLEQWVEQVSLLCGPGAGKDGCRGLTLKAGARLLEVGVGGGVREGGGGAEGRAVSVR